jgi:hypothetical protein
LTDEVHTVSKPQIQINNLILGSMYFDLVGEIKGLNEKTGDSLTITFNPKSYRSGSFITGKAMDKNGNIKF